MEKIAIIGCGWLGMALANELNQKSFQVIGSTTSQEKLAQISSIGAEAVLFQLDPMPKGEHFQKLFDCKSLIINIPPASRSNPPEFYQEQIKYLKYMINNSSVVQRVIFISSTSYYPNTNEIVNEDTPYDFDKGSNKSVVWAEQEIEQINKELIILRCGGLLGHDRIPGKYFAGKETSGKNNPTNYIHRDDVIHEISNLLETTDWPKIKNMVHPAHYKRKEVVEAMSKKYGFERPHWKSPDRTATKTVESLHAFKELIDPLEF